MNEYFSIGTSYIAGNKLSSIREKCRGYVLEMVSSQRGFSIAQPSLLHMHAIALAEGLDVLASEQIDGVSGLKDILGISMKRKDTAALAFHKTHSLTRAFLFRQLNETSNEVNMSDAVFAKKIPIRPIVLTTVFIEALIFFQFARHSKDAAKWIAKGDFLLEKIQSWDAQGRWNFRNKRLLLEAEKMYLTGQFDQAQSLYIESIQSAKEHRFIHEQAIASELAGMFYYERGFQSKARLLLKHSVRCFKQWGAMAVARRIEANIQQLFAQDLQKGSSWMVRWPHFLTKKRATQRSGNVYNKRLMQLRATYLDQTHKDFWTFPEGRAHRLKKGFHTCTSQSNFPRCSCSFSQLIFYA